MKKIFLILMLICSVAYADQSLTYTTPHQLSQLHDELIAAGITPLYITGDGTNLNIIIDDLTPSASVDAVVAAHIPMTEDQLKDVWLRRSSKLEFDGQTVKGQVLRCFSKAINDRMNQIAGKVNSVMSCISGGSNLSQVKSCVGGLAPLNEAVTLAQAKTAIKTCIDGGDVDEP